MVLYWEFSFIIFIQKINVSVLISMHLKDILISSHPNIPSWGIFSFYSVNPLWPMQCLDYENENSFAKVRHALYKQPSFTWPIHGIPTYLRAKKEKGRKTNSKTTGFFQQTNPVNSKTVCPTWSDRQGANLQRIFHFTSSVSVVVKLQLSKTYSLFTQTNTFSTTTATFSPLYYHIPSHPSSWPGFL